MPRGSLGFFCTSTFYETSYLNCIVSLRHLIIPLDNNNFKKNIFILIPTLLQEISFNDSFIVSLIERISGLVRSFFSNFTFPPTPLLFGLPLLTSLPPLLG